MLLVEFRFLVTSMSQHPVKIFLRFSRSTVGFDSIYYTRLFSCNLEVHRALETKARYVSSKHLLNMLSILMPKFLCANAFPELLLRLFVMVRPTSE